MVVRVAVGRVGRPHGLDGSFFVEEPSDDPQWFAVDAELYVEGEAARVVASKHSRGRPVIRLDRKVQRGAELTVPRSALPPTGEDEYYVADLIGLHVTDEGGAEIGRVVAVEPYEANDVLELDTGALLPLVEDCVREVDLEAGRIIIAPGFAEPR